MFCIHQGTLLVTRNILLSCESNKVGNILLLLLFILVAFYCATQNNYSLRQRRIVWRKHKGGFGLYFYLTLTFDNLIQLIVVMYKAIYELWCRESILKIILN